MAVAEAAVRLSDDQVRERVAVLKRLKELLLRQRLKFESYMEILGHQKDDIEKGDVEAMTAHAELEQSVVREIFTIQKVIDPLEDMYSAAYPAAESEVPQLKASLESMKREVLRQSDGNRALLKERMGAMRREIDELKTGSYKRPRSVYGLEGGGSLIDIQG
jgi:hypothetical protein